MNKVLTILLILLSVGSGIAQDGRKVQFHNLSFEQAFEQAKREGKQVFVNYSIKGCAPCKEMEETVYTNSRLAYSMNQNFVCIKLDPMKNKGLRKRAKEEHKVNGFPTVIFFTVEGEIISNNTGFRDVTTMKQLVDEAIKKNK